MILGSEECGSLDGASFLCHGLNVHMCFRRTYVSMQINNVVVTGMELDQVVNLMRGPEGLDLHLHLRQPRSLRYCFHFAFPLPCWTLTHPHRNLLTMLSTHLG